MSKYFNGDKLSSYEDSPITYVHNNMEKFNKVISDLEAKLAEKEKEIESYKHFKITIGTMENNQVDISSTTYTDQDKISFAVEQLEKLKKFVKENESWEIKGSDYSIVYADDVLDQIDNQINVLRNNKDGIH